MSQALIKTNTEISKWTKEQKGLVKRTYAPDLTDDEYQVFLAQAEALDLNPLRKEIYPMKIKGRLLTIVGIDGYYKHSANYPFILTGTEYQHNDAGDLVSATVFAKTIKGGDWHEVSTTCLLSEYWKKGGMWDGDGMPYRMLEKVAQAKLIRIHCTGDNASMAGTYIAEEVVDVASPIVTQAKVTNTFDGREAVALLADKYRKVCSEMAHKEGAPPKKLWEDVYHDTLKDKLPDDATQEDIDKLKDAWEQIREELAE